tara:strand:+ start:160 stop:327 length:168 start_codon:yes stop_codon:yes gene_type:complete
MIKLGSMDVEKHPDGDLEITVPEYLSSEYLGIEDQEALVEFLQENIRQHKEKENK